MAKKNSIPQGGLQEPVKSEVQHIETVLVNGITIDSHPFDLSACLERFVDNKYNAHGELIFESDWFRVIIEDNSDGNISLTVEPRILISLSDENIGKGCRVASQIAPIASGPMRNSFFASSRKQLTALKKARVPYQEILR